ncbi:tyrosinase family protein [Psychrobacter sp. P11G5]|uniref:tyrosinase family protein n=1 Tax=Psychrobacter sp. P11G5 TaxID=1699624 RepID=UPI00083199CE|nr:tyrosinase family protein [Psychrobacter sp. P11G5]
MTCRKNVNALTTEEKAAFITAIKLMKAEEYVYVDNPNDEPHVRARYPNITNTYDKYVLDHHIAMYTGTPGGWGNGFLTRNAVYRGPAFLPWQREFIRRFELDLDRLVPGVTLPYWDWASDAADPMNAVVWTNDLMGGNGSGASRVVRSGPFAYDDADPDNSWVIINYLGLPDGGLVRNFGSRRNTPNLPTQADIDEIQQISTYDSGNFDTSSVGYRGANEGRIPVNGKTPPPSNTHALVHEWIAGSMMLGTSPNDPVFFLHHCFVDKLWADWQALHPTVPYVPGNTASNNLNGHRLNDELVGLGTLISATLDHHAMGYSYDTDTPPIVTPVNTTLVFNDTPVGSTAVQAVTFNISTPTPDNSFCRDLIFTITAGPTGTGFGTPNGDRVVVNRDNTNTAQVWFSYTATSDTDPVTGEAEITSVQTGQTWHISLSATTITKPTVATVLVLDKSGSMAWDAGDGRSRIEVLKDSAPIFVDLLGDDDGIGVVYFDSNATPGTPIAVAGAAGTGSGRIAANEAITNQPSPPGGSTSIGSGIELASSELDDLTSGSYNHTAMVVLTDGRENRTPYISQLIDDGIINDSVFAIGLGTTQQIRPAALEALTGSTNGYVLMTGTLDSNDYFTLQKYFLQILSGVKNTEVVMDPEGWIQPDREIRIPFDLNEADITADAILLTGDVLPDVFDYVLETPSGKIIDPSIANASVELVFSANEHMQFYRMTLPTAVAGFEEREGQWHAVLNLNEKVFAKYLASLENDRKKYDEVKTHGLRYSFNVHSSSDLRLRAQLEQATREPGGMITLSAQLTQYERPLDNGASVRVELERPNGTKANLTLSEVEPGVFNVTFNAGSAGVYKVRVLAKGQSIQNNPFTREQLLSASVWIGGDDPLPSSSTDGGEQQLCHLLMCLLEKDSIRSFLKRQKIEPEEVSECLKKVCEDDDKPEF